MTPDDMANYHEHMSEWCHAQAQQDDGILGVFWIRRTIEHNESFQYWCAQANPGREKEKEG